MLEAPKKTRMLPAGLVPGLGAAAPPARKRLRPMALNSWINARTVRTPCLCIASHSSRVQVLFTCCVADEPLKAWGPLSE